MQEGLDKRLCFILLDKIKSKGIYSAKSLEITFDFTLFLGEKTHHCGGEGTFQKTLETTSASLRKT